MLRLLLLLALWGVCCLGFTDQLRVVSTSLIDIVDYQQSLSGFQLPIGRNLTLIARGILDDSLLFARQLECPTGTYGCPNGRCCYDGQTCVANGCCDEGDEQCGSDGCYNPTTEVCCSDIGLLCNKGYTCMAGGGCCPDGEEKCASNGCYNTNNEICCQDGRLCPKGYDCVSGGCCPSGQQPCGSTKCYDPNTQICCTDSNSIWACASDLSCCSESQSCYDRNSEICCAGGACPEGDTCCGKECCKPVATCGTDGFCTATASSTQRSTITSTKRSTITSTSTMKMTSSCTTPTLSTSQIKTETISFVYDPSRSWVAKSGPNAGQTITGSNEAVISNMCDGINEFNKGAGGNTLTLTHGGKCFQKQNRKNMCPQGWCANGVKSYIQSIYPSGPPSWVSAAITAAGDMTCDEFPFASSVEGGNLNNGVRVCVPSEDNGWQGRTMSPFFNPNLKIGQLINIGERYVVEIVGWDCNTRAPSQQRRSAGLQARDAFSGGWVNITGPEMYHNFDPSNPGMMLMSMPLGDLSAGSYTINLNIAGGNLNLTLVDYNGQMYNMTQSGSTVSFTLDDDAPGVSLTGTTYNGNVSVVYSATSVGGSTATATVTSSASAKSGGSRMKPMSFGTKLGVLSVAVIFLYF